MMDAIYIYITFPDFAQAQRIGRALVEDRLAACANILPGMNTVYRWQGKIETGQETVMLVKTIMDQFERLSTYVKAHHPYDCPCIVALPLVAGEPSYMEWIAAESRPAVPA